MSTTESVEDELSLTVDVDVKKADYITDWDGDERKLVQQVATHDDDVDKAMEMVEGWDRWPMPVMVIIGRTQEGQRVVLLNTEVRPYFYVPIEEFDAELESNQKVTSIEHGHEDPNGRNMVRVYTRIPGDVPKLRDEYDHHEADIMFPQRFLIDTGIEDGVEIPVEHATEYPTQISLDEMQPTECNAQSRVCFCDIEVDDEPGFPDQDVAEQEITSITVYDSYEEDYVVYMYHPDTPDITHEEAEVHVFDNEQDMLEEFILYMHRRRFDIMTGWNFDDFDARYIVNRLDFISELYEDSKLDKNLFSLLGSAYDEGYFGAKVKGTVVFDMLRAYKNTEFSELESYSLDYVAQKELGDRKIEDNRDLYKIWKNEPQKFANYNVKDVELTVRLEEEQGIIKFYEEIADYVGGRLKDCIGIHNAVDIKILREVYDKWAVPSGAQAEGMDFEGGEVFDPISGIKKNVIVLDLKSLYPMCMKTLNAGINTKDPDGELTAANGVSFSTDQTALVVDIIDELLEKRQKFKDKRDKHKDGSQHHIVYDRKQGAVKVIMNCFSGDTEVATPDGIRNIKEIEVGDEVYSINPDTHDLEVKPVVDATTQDNEYNELKHIETSDTDFKITPNHRMFVENKHRDSPTDRSFIEHYQDLSDGYTYQIPSHNPKGGEGVDKFSLLDFGVGRLWLDVDVHGRTFRSEIPSELNYNIEYSKNRASYKIDDIQIYQKHKDVIDRFENTLKIQYGDRHASIPVEYDMDNWLELMGWYISEGCTHHVESNSQQGIGSYSGESKRIQISQQIKKNVTNINQLVSSMGINYTSHSNGIDVSNTILYKWFKENCGTDSYDKQIPEWVFKRDLSVDQYKKLLKALVRGDGQVQNATKVRYSTMSDKLKEDVVKLAILCGYKPKVKSGDGGIWRIFISKDNGSFKKSKTESIEHDGKVHCITVEDNHTVLAGSNGKFQWTGNTLYGVLGWSSFRLADEDVGAAVTSTGRSVIKFSEEVVEAEGYDVIYGDTDSIMLELGDGVTEEEAIDIGKDLEEMLNDAYDDFAKEEFNADEHFFEMEFEKLYKRYFQAGKKKRYAGHITYKEGEHLDKLDTVGFETERADYCQVAKTFLEEVLSLLVRGGDLRDLHELVTTTFEKVRGGDYDFTNLGIASSISQDFDSYDNKTQGVKGAEYANKHLNDSITPGDKPKKYFIKSIGRSSEFGKEKPVPPRDGDGNMFVAVSNPSVIPDVWKIDWDVLIEKQFEAPLQRVLEGTNWNYNEVLTGDRRPRLDEFESSNESASVVTSVEDEVLEEAIDGQTDDEFTEDLEDVDRDVLKDALEAVKGEDEDVDKIIEANFTGPEGDEYELDRFV